MVERKAMTTQWQRALIASLLLILSSLAGCLGGGEEPESATVIASTYHVAQLAEAVGGNLVDVEMMSTSNVPVHDYEPSATDIIRLNSADVFLYHGLGLEPWVDGALADLADDGPATYSTHAMPSGEDTLDFQSILINKLCTSMTGPATTDVHTLAHHPHEAEELHGDDGGHNFAFPDHGEEHDHDEEEHDHDEDEHDHGDHDALSPEMTFDNPEGCDAGTSINVFHMEAGEYMLEFESESEDPFRMAIAGMGGAHDHGHGHGHGGHGDGGFEWAGVFEMNDDSHTWSMQKVDGVYADPTMWLVLIPTDSPTEDTMHDLEGGIDALVDAGCTVVEDGESMSSIAADGTCFELHVGTGDDSTFTIDTAGITGMAMYAQHVPTEFERDQHYLKDSAGVDIEPVAQEGAGAHDHGHGEEEIAFDPHSWLDPVAYAAQVEVVYTALSAAFPDNADAFRDNADAYKAQLADLDAGFSAAFGESGTCQKNTVAANHNAYAYISQRYGIEFVNLHGIDPEGEPSPAAVADVLERVRDDGVTAIYVEEYTPNGALDSLIQDTKSADLPNGIEVLTLHTLEMAPADSNDNYITLMTENLENLKTGLACQE